jgi:hypothetical protein
MLTMADGHVLYAGKRGERWLYHPPTRSLQAGAALAPEDLIAIVRLDEGGFWFVGASGTTYEARDPLGPFVRSSAPLEPLVKASATSRTIVGISRQRRLMRSTNAAASFQRVGPDQMAFVDVAMGDDGKGLALALPEQLFVTADEGATWSRLDVPTRGVLSLERHLKYGIIVLAALGPMRLAPDATKLVHLPQETERAPQAESVPPRGPSAGAVAEGRAVITRERYVELARTAESAQNWLWLMGPLDGKLTSAPAPELKGCRNVRLAASERVLQVACFRSAIDGNAQSVEFFRNEALGRKLEHETFTADANLASFKMAVGANGTLLVTGICPGARAGTSCSAAGVYVRREAQKPPVTTPNKRPSTKSGGKYFELIPAATPSLADVALALTFSLDGRVAYAVGRRTKTGAYAVFVSRDAGSSFEAEELSVTSDGDRDETQEFWDRSSAPVGVTSFVPAEDGTLALVFGRRQMQSLMVVDENGKVMSVANAPEERALISAAGMRALALSPSTRDAWESLDGGASWNSVGRFPIALCSEDENCEVPVRCAPAGCLIGDEISRIGWSGQADDDANLLPPPQPSSADVSDRKLRVPLSCTLEEASWKPLPGVEGLPTAFESAMGKTAWFALSIDDARASVSIYQAQGGARPRVQAISLLGPVQRPESYALIALDQVEGAAALRYQIAEAHAGDPRLRNVEVAWSNFFEGRTVKTRIPEAGTFSPGDYTRGQGRTQRAEPDLLSIGEGGLYLRLHQAAGERQETLFLDGKQISKLPEVTWPGLRLKGSRAEMAHVDGVHVPLQIIGRGVAVTRARRENNGWQFDAVTTGLADPSAFGMAQVSNIAYVGQRAGLYVETRALNGTQAEGMVLPFRATGSVVDPKVMVPTQLDVGDRPERCDANVRTSTPRVVAQFHSGTRHAVIVSDAADAPHLLLTSHAVLHGTPREACVATFDAESVAVDSGTQTRSERAIIPLDDLEHSWLFRAVAETGTEQAHVEYRGMNCRFDANVEIPPEIFRAAGSVGPRTAN